MARPLTKLLVHDCERYQKPVVSGTINIYNNNAGMHSQVLTLLAG